MDVSGPLRLGIDLVDIARFARVADDPGGCRLVFTAAELAHADTLGEGRRREYLAGRFCAKEATAKALGRGFSQGLYWHDIEVTGDAYGAPRVALSGGAQAVAARSHVERVDLSLSHQAGLAVCVAIAVSPAERPPCPRRPAVRRRAEPREHNHPLRCAR